MFPSLDPWLEDWGGGEKMSSQSQGRDEGALGGLVPSAHYKPSTRLGFIGLLGILLRFKSVELAP